jgi:glycosyltransferase involved in cell wall biosynthesis
VSTTQAPLTAIVLTHNEAGNIGPCLEDLNWVDEVIVVDSYSQDRTLELAQETRPDVRIFQNPFEDFGQQRNWALDETHPRHDWILFFDADERCPEGFQEAVTSTVRNPRGKVGFYLCYRNFFLGTWLKRTTFFPSWQLRLLRRGEVRYTKMGHGQMEVTDGPLDYINEPYDHFGFSKGISQWIARHNAYSTEEVELIQQQQREPLALRELWSTDPVVRRRCLKRLAARNPLRPWMRFVYAYFVQLGFLDGRAGLLYCLLRLSHDLQIAVKLAEAEHLQRVEERNGRSTAAPRVGVPSGS